MKDEYRIDSHKIHLHPARVAQWLSSQDDWEKAKELFPIYMEIGPVGFCNHHCTFCGVDYMVARPEKPMLDPQVCEDLLTDMGANGVKAAMFGGAGEPLLYKPLANMIVYAGKQHVDTAITTNGTLLLEKFMVKAFAAERLRWIKVSLNAGDAETYNKIHRGREGDFERVLSNLENAVRVRTEIGSSVTLGVQLVALPETSVTDSAHPLVKQVVPSNISTIEPLARRLRDIGVDYLVVKPYSQHLMSEDTRIYEDVGYADAVAWYNNLESLSTDAFKVVVRRQTMALYGAEERGYDRCQATPNFWAYVEADGNVWTCSTYLGRQEGGVVYGDDRFRVGNLNQKRFVEIWRGEQRHQNWEYVRTALDIQECRKNCRMHQVNMHLWEILHPGSHGSFI